MKSVFKAFVAGAVLALGMVGSASAAQDTPAGLWETIDDKTGLARSHVRIVDNGGVLEGRVEKVLNKQPDDDPDGLCRKCEGARKDKPVVGMTILWGLKRDDDVWKGGEILDPKSGKVYKCKMELIEDGRRLKVRGFIGVSLIGRSQTWNRLE
jgi:uncharacterized protein (DUF2147 family)